MNLATRVEKKRVSLGMTQSDLGQKVGLAQNSIHNIESGETKRPRKLEALAKALQCSEEWLQYGVGELDNATIGPSIKRTIPLINYIQAGSWKEINQDINQLKENGGSYNMGLICPVNCSELTFALRVQGVSMEPKFNNGDLIFVDPEAMTENGSYVVARLDDENQATFKQLIIEGDKRFLKPVNPNWPDQLIAINGNCTIVGKVIFTGKEL